MRTALPLLLCFALAACSGSGAGPSDGEVHLGLENASQSAAAGAPTYPAPVYAKLTRSQSTAAPGLHLVTPLHADTIAVGVVISNQFVCVSDEGNGAPQVADGILCKRTDLLGNARFVFRPGTRVGSYRYPMCTRARETDACPTRDTVRLTVTPRAVAYTTLVLGRLVGAGTTTDGRIGIEPGWFKDDGGGPAAFRVIGSGWLPAAGDTLGTVNGRALRPDTTAQVGDTARIVFVSATQRLLVATARVTFRVPRPDGVGYSISIRPDSLYIPSRPEG